MIFPQSVPPVPESLLQLTASLGPPDGLPLGNGDLSAILAAGPGVLSFRIALAGTYLGDLRLTAPGPPPGNGADRPCRTTSGSSAILRLFDATARATIREGVSVEAFVAWGRSLVALRIRSNHPDPVPATLELHAPGPAARFRTDGPFRYLLPTSPAGLTGALCAFVHGARSRSETRADALVTAFDVPPAGECAALIGAVSTPGNPDPLNAARAEVERALPHGYLLLQREHAVAWQRFWTSLETGDSETTDYRGIYQARVAGCGPGVTACDP